MTEYEEMLVAAGMISEADCDVEYQEYLRTFRVAPQSLKGALIAHKGQKAYNYAQWKDRRKYAEEVIASNGKHPHIEFDLWGAEAIWREFRKTHFGRAT